MALSGDPQHMKSEATQHGEEARPLVIVANPSADLYGADLQMLESVTGLLGGGFDVLVVSPDDGPLTSRLQDRGATVERLSYPVLRRAQASARGVLGLGGQGVLTALRLARFLRKRHPTAVYVNTVTLPWWILAARLARVPVVCHVHEAERQDSRPVRLALYTPLLGASHVIVNSRATGETVDEAVPLLSPRCTLVYNGVPGPSGEIAAAEPAAEPFRLALISRLSPRKGIDVALESVSIVRCAGMDVRLEIAGTAFEGYEWFENQLRRRAEESDLRGAVTFSGYVDPVWPVLDRAHVALAPSFGESLGNAVIEAQLAGRPVIASRVSGHTESVEHERTGLLVDPRDSGAMADAIVRLLREPELVECLVDAARVAARRRFSVGRYQREVCDVVRLVSR